MLSTKECALQIVKVKIYTEYEQGKKFECCRSAMVLGKWFPREHIGVRHMVWQKDLGKKNGHLEDRMLFDVTEGKIFN